MPLDRWLNLIPAAWTSLAWFWWLTLAVFGLALFVMGSRVSRSLLTLFAVAVAAIVGKAAPHVLGLKLDPMATTCGFAAVAGVLTYIFHRWVLALLLAILLSFWVALTLIATEASLTPASLHDLTQIHSLLAQKIAAMSALALVVALATSVLFPRLALAWFWALLGTTLMLVSALAWGGERFAHAIPGGATVQWGGLAVLLVAGIVLQYRGGVAPVPSPRPEAADADDTAAAVPSHA